MLKKIVDRVRKNHGIEHGTVTILLEEGARPPLGGYSVPGGFFVFGKIPRETLTDAVSRAHSRMIGGDSELAISPYCGTNLATGALIGNLMAKILFKKAPAKTRGALIGLATVVGAFTLGRPIGILLQRKFTVLSEVRDVEVVNISSFSIGSFTFYKVSTRFDD